MRVYVKWGLCSLLFLVLLVLPIFGQQAFADDRGGVSGSCRWHLDLDEGVLAISPKDGQVGDFDRKVRNSYASYSSSVKKLVIEGRVRVSHKNSQWICSYLENLEEVDLSGLDTSNEESFENLFAGCKSLKSIDGLFGLDTTYVMNLGNMFAGCESLKELDLSKFKVNCRCDTSGMFGGCNSLERLILGSLSTSDSKGMFAACSSLKTLNISGLRTSSVENMGSMFRLCNSLQSVDLSSLNTCNVKDMSAMFEGCSSLESLDVSNFDNSSVPDWSKMFAGCSSLRTIYDDGGFYESIKNHAMSSKGMFDGCEKLVGGNGTVWKKVDSSCQLRADVDKVGSPGYFTCIHPWWGQLYQEEKATCVKDGFKTLSCAKCGKVLSTSSTSSFGHVAGSPQVSVEPATFSKRGIRSYATFCMRCGEQMSQRTESINRLKGYTWNKKVMYTGSNIPVTLEIWDEEGTRLVEGRDYEKSLDEVKETGVYGIWAGGIGDYSFDIAFEVNVEEKVSSVSASNPNSTSIKKLVGKKKGFIAKWKKVAGIKGYQVRWSTKSNMTKSKAIKTTVTSKKVKHLKKKTKYYVQVRTYKVVNNKAYYSNWSKKRAVRTK